MNFKRKFNLAQHIQEVENSQGWKKTAKFLMSLGFCGWVYLG